MAAPAVLKPSVLNHLMDGEAYGTMHKRGHSASSSITLGSSAPLDPALTGKRKVSYSDEVQTASAEQNGGHSLKIKPYLRKLSLRDNKTLDLSRPSAENESLASLGIHDFASSRSASDVTSPAIRRARHNRSTSNTSQFSTASSGLQRPTVPYVHPMRQTPRPYTPPISRSHTTSVMGSETSDEPNVLDATTRRSGSISSLPTAPPPLTIPTSSSLTRLNVLQQNPSLSSLPSMPTTCRSRGDTLRSIETVSPSSRTSIDKTVSFIRAGPRDEATADPNSRAAHIMAARIAYAERESAKERKVEKETLKQQDRENKKRKKEEQKRRQSESDEKKAKTRSRGNSSSEKMEFVGKAYTDYNPAHTRSLPAHVPPPLTANYARTTASSRQGFNKSVKGTWLGFLAWFKTRLLRVGSKLRLKKK